MTEAESRELAQNFRNPLKPGELIAEPSSILAAMSARIRKLEKEVYGLWAWIAITWVALALTTAILVLAR